MWHIMEMLQAQYTLTEQLTNAILQSKSQKAEEVNETLEELLDNGASAGGMPGDEFLFCPIHAAAKVGNSQIIDLLVNRGADVNCVDSFGRVPLHYAAETSTKAVLVLLNNEAFPNVPSEDLNTPLHWASYKNMSKSVQLLLKHGACVNTQNQNNDTPLSFAAMRGNAESVRILLDFGADISICNYTGKTPFMKISIIHLGGVKFPGDELTYRLLKAASGHIAIDPKSPQAKFLSQDGELREHFKNLSKTLQPLTVLCRKAIRDCLVNQYMPEALHRLRLPKFVINYILLRDCI